MSLEAIVHFSHSCTVCAPLCLCVWICRCSVPMRATQTCLRHNHVMSFYCIPDNDIMLALKRTYIFKNTSILIIFNLDELMRQNSYLKSEMLSEMQMLGAVTRSKFWVHTLAAF